MARTPSTPSPDRRVSRRHFLLASAALPASAALAGPAQALVRVDQHQVYTDAANAYGVPIALLTAVSYAQTRWQDHDGAPSVSLGYGPMHLIDGAAADAALGRADKPGARALDTLGEAAAASGLAKDRLRSDPAANVRGGAALLAARQRAAGRPVGTTTDPATWYATVARASGLGNAQAQLTFADSVLAGVRSGTTLRLADGSRLATPRSKAGSPGAQRVGVQRSVEIARRAAPRGTPPIEAPPGLDVEWIPAPYEEFRDSSGQLTYGNHDLAKRPGSPPIRYVVIHDTECRYPVALDLIQLATRPASWQYTLRSSDGHIAQHLALKDVGWHAGNWYVNALSVGLEHEGFAAQGAPWYSEAMYTTSAKLTRHLCDTYRIPMDRAHIIGHDQVPGATTELIPEMHWDPGPFWDWEHYFELLGAPLDRGTIARRRPVPGRVIRILPGFAGNKQPITGCAGPGNTCGDKDCNYVTLRVAPSHDAALVNDKGLHQKGQPATTAVFDISARATAGEEFVVASVRTDWTAIWYLGLKAWFYNPRKAPTARPVTERRMIARVFGAPAKTYGRCYPEASAYPNPADVQAISPLLYTIPVGQAYVVTDAAPLTAYYKARTFSPDTPGDHVNIVGRDRYYQISFGHRLSYVRAADVRVR